VHEVDLKRSKARLDIMRYSPFFGLIHTAANNLDLTIHHAIEGEWECEGNCCEPSKCDRGRCPGGVAGCKTPQQVMETKRIQAGGTRMKAGICSCCCPSGMKQSNLLCASFKNLCLRALFKGKNEHNNQHFREQWSARAIQSRQVSHNNKQQQTCPGRC
jgi:hypothetical protein